MNRTSHGFRTSIRLKPRADGLGLAAGRRAGRRSGPGVLRPDRENLAGEKRWLAGHTQPGSPGTGLGQALDGADVFIGVSAAGVLGEQDVARTADGASCSPWLIRSRRSIDPDIARRHVAVVATGRSDQPNQINNVLAFLGIFRGLLDGGAADLTVAAQCAATRAIAGPVPDDKLDTGHIVPDVFDDHLMPAVARAVMDA
jgi:malate dehydrogenase (oxaloacetate-decarboxylating)